MHHNYYIKVVHRRSMMTDALKMVMVGGYAYGCEGQCGNHIGVHIQGTHNMVPGVQDVVPSHDVSDGVHSCVLFFLPQSGMPLGGRLSASLLCQQLWSRDQ